MVQADISGLTYFMPIFGFVFVFVIMFALLDKSKLLGDNKFINVVISAIIGIVFATVSSVQEYVQLVTPWFAVIVLALFFILIIIGLSGQKTADIAKPWLVWSFIIILILVFILAAGVHFTSLTTAWNQLVYFFIYQAKIANALALIVIGVIVALIIAKK